MDKRTILVTGANGFIGSYAARRLRARYRVLGIDTNASDLFGSCNEYCQMVLPDADLEELLRLKAPAACLHFAGSASVGHSMEHPSHDFTAGPVALFQLLDAMRKAAPGCTLFFPSSAAVYGNPKGLPIGENSELAPISPYGHHKLISEQVIKEFSEVYGVNGVILRIFSCYGPGLRKQLLWDVCEKIADGRLELFGSGNETRDFIHVDDVTAALEHLLDAGVTHGRFNLAGGEQTSIRKVAETLAKAYGGDVVPEFNGQTRPGDPLCWQADVSALAGTGFSPATPLAQGLSDYALWHKRQAHERR